MRTGEHIDVAFVCDAGPEVGAGHVMRSLALAEELAARGKRAAYFADLAQLPWVQGEVLRRVPQVFSRTTERELMNSLTAIGPAYVVFDSYTLSLDFLRTARSRWRTLAMVDGAAGHPEADVVVDQNLGAEGFGHATATARMLAGATFALIRDDVRVHRPARAPNGHIRDGELLRLLIVMGGTDPLNATPSIIASAASTELPCHITAVSSEETEELRARVSLRSGQTLECVSPGAGLARRMARADVVVSASGSTVLELFALGACTALVKVAENQAVGYDAAVSRGLGVGLGSVHSLDQPRDQAQLVSTLRDLFTDASARSLFRRRAWHSVDGAGRQRVADALLAH